MSNHKKEEGTEPVFISEGKGARLYDLNGVEYIDYSLGMGPNILGYSHSAHQQAIIEQARRFYSSDYTDVMYDAVNKVVTRFPSAEKVRFTSSGAKVNDNAIRVARAYTGRRKHVRYKGHYHGCPYTLNGGTKTESPEPKLIQWVAPDQLFTQLVRSNGWAGQEFKGAYMIEWNELHELKNLLDGHSTDIAAVIMEPVMANFFGCTPESGYLESVRALCTHYAP